ncbi:hypothetical protein [Extensimonas vulgaris]|uniref:hypothetical protein n=1 Tax=Extensimonas vulgaris TaxID=1031594 RepID=UPI00119D6A9E|nr:hypothetical protein [Extensimonas vulgaris]TXD16420.1 hypothetical protein FUT63_03160 [Extensimonas vulgaris]
MNSASIRKVFASFCGIRERCGISKFIRARAKRYHPAALTHDGGYSSAVALADRQRLEEVNKPPLVLIQVPMGKGKTEAAFLRLQQRLR